MPRFIFKKLLNAAIVLAGLLNCANVDAGGSGLNTLVIVNQNSSDSCALGNYFCELRQVPPENVIRISWTGGNISWTGGDFQTNLLTPVFTALSDRRLTNQIDLAVLSMDIPFQTVNGKVVNATTSALFYGLKTESGPEWQGITNSYAASENSFRTCKPASAPGYSFLTTMITANTLGEAKQIVDQGVNSDGSFPTQPVVLAKSSDPLRNVRYHAFDNALFNARIRGNYSVLQTNSDSPGMQLKLLGFQTGLAGYTVPAGTFVPGAMADSLTSFGGIIFGPNGQTSLLEFLRAGAAGSYGTVTEPSPDPSKFPDPMVYFYQSRGFSLVECYYQSLVIPYQGLIVGEPLAAPFARHASGQWTGIATNTVLTGTASLSLHFTADHERPIQQVDLFVDGKYFQTLTNLPPKPGDQLRVSLKSFPFVHTIVSNDTLASITEALSSLINAPAATNATGIVALSHGDRIELRYFSTNALNRPTPPLSVNKSTGPVSDSANAASTPAFALSSSSASAGSVTTHLHANRQDFLSSPALGLKRFTVNGTIQIGSWLQLAATKTNGAFVNLAVTNQSATAKPIDLCLQLIALINATAGLQAVDGILADDLIAGWNGSAAFNLRARSPGYNPAGINVNLSGSENFVIAPTGQGALTDNVADLLPRNHLYITTGTTNLPLSFSLDTTALADGFHELTAVAYEGSHVRTQTRRPLPVQIRNSSVTASLTSADLTNSVSARGTYHLQVSANTNAVSAISLFSTGGLLSTVTNQSSAAFTIDASQLGAGLHSFYALLRTSAGNEYRTQPLWIRFAD
jgi:uncharacterized protein (TIGR03790 family)